MQRVPSMRRVRGLTLVELAAIFVVIGLLAALGVPHLLRSVESSRASAAFAYLDAVRSAQERYQAREGTYADNLAKLDTHAPMPRSFRGPIGGAIDLESRPGSWILALTREGDTAGYGAYTVAFTERGFCPPGCDGPVASTIPAAIIPSGEGR